MKDHIVPRDWCDEPVAIVAAGFSINAFDFTKIEGVKTIAVKDGHLVAPHAEVLMIGDHRYVRRRKDFSGYLGNLILYTDPHQLPEAWASDARIHFIPKVAGGGLSTNPRELRGTFSTVSLAINYAVLRGARSIYLIGVDGKPGPRGERHFNNPTPEDFSDRYNRQRWGYQRLVRDLSMLGVPVYNMNRESDIHTFPFATEVDL